MTTAATERLQLLAICNYPSDSRPAHQVFTASLLRELGRSGVDVKVVAPEPLWNRARKTTGFRLAPRFEMRDGLPVHRPRYLTFSDCQLPVGGPTPSWSVNSHWRAVRRESDRLAGPVDVCLGYFLYAQGFSAVQLASRLGVPAVVSLGDSGHRFQKYEATFGRRAIQRLLDQCASVITNSTLTKERCVDRYGQAEDKVHHVPSGIDAKTFRPLDRRIARRRCGLPQDRPIIVSVGQFIERKGPRRVLEAIQARPDIGAVFLGSGPQVPRGKQVLFQGPVPHDDVTTWLNAADIFVLPTLDEGCCNALVEALGCGLPIVTSDLPCNRQIVGQDTAVLTNPRDVGAIGRAIARLVDEPERRRSMSRAALQRSTKYVLSARADRVAQLLRSLCLPKPARGRTLSEAASEC